MESSTDIINNIVRIAQLKAHNQYGLQDNM